MKNLHNPTLYKAVLEWDEAGVQEALKMSPKPYLTRAQITEILVKALNTQNMAQFDALMNSEPKGGHDAYVLHAESIKLEGKRFDLYCESSFLDYVAQNAKSYGFNGWFTHCADRFLESAKKLVH